MVLQSKDKALCPIQIYSSLTGGGGMCGVSTEVGEPIEGGVNASYHMTVQITAAIILCILI